jgi:hypothetical protein
MKIQTRLATLTVLLATTILPLKAQSDGVDKSIDTMLGDNAHPQVRQLVTDLQQAVAAHDPAAVAALVHYPIRVKLHGKPTNLNTPKAFVKNYDSIITPDIATVIGRQKYEALFVNYQGAMLGEGEVWITGFCTDNTCKHPDIKIGTIQSTTTQKP